MTVSVDALSKFPTRYSSSSSEMPLSRTSGGTESCPSCERGSIVFGVASMLLAFDASEVDAGALDVSVSCVPSSVSPRRRFSCCEK